MDVLLLAGSAAFVGFIHSLSPAHWLPLVLIAKSRKWNRQVTFLGALTAAAGHILVSLLVAGAVVGFGTYSWVNYEEEVERYGGLLLVVFGLLYAILNYRRHHACHGHGHHGPNPKNTQKPFAFLFMLGFSPCFAVLPIFIAAAPHGPHGLFTSAVAFAVGVIAALGGAGWLVSSGKLELDHPLLEHYADVIAGGAIAIVGVILYFTSHGH
ncbi:MAG: hypothetical protein AB7P04_08995 [Bacteriovoracia bacterium]